VYNIEKAVAQVSVTAFNNGTPAPQSHPFGNVCFHREAKRSIKIKGTSFE
jgi:hypothetical protein